MTMTLLMLAMAFTPESAMRSALDGAAEWTMTRTVKGSSRPLISSGTVDCRLGRGIVWKVLEPFESSVEMTTNSMVFADEDGVRVKPLDELPYYSEIRRRTDAFAAGDGTAFKGLFELDRTVDQDGGWKLVLRPEVSAMRRLIREVELSGARLPTNVVMKTGDGGVSCISFKEKKGAR